jgi:hypothetical protein
MELSRGFEKKLKICGTEVVIGIITYHNDGNGYQSE